MLTEIGNLWTIEADARCITTNGIVKRDGTAVMGAGVAKQAVARYPGVDRVLGDFLSQVGNHVHYLGKGLISFPTKHDWKNPSNIKLIERSAKELVDLTDTYQWQRVAMPPPGCGLGNLDWNDVKPVLDQYLDDRFIVVFRSL